jgi:hypothetical protein
MHLALGALAIGFFVAISLKETAPIKEASRLKEKMAASSTMRPIKH